MLLPLVLFACAPANETALPGSAGADPDTAGVAGVAQAALTPPKVELGPADPELAPLIPVTAVAYELPGGEREYLRGRAGTGRKLPKRAGRGGELLVAVDSPYQLFARGDTYVHVAAWRQNGRPASGASVFVGTREVGRTDSTGSLVFRFAVTEDELDALGYDSLITVIDGQDRCGAVPFSPYERTPSFASDNLFVYADRGVYRPGERIRLRGLGWRLTDDYAPLEAAAIEIQLRDGDGHTLAAASPSTDELGVFEVELPLPATAAEGLYELRVAYGQERATARLQIRDFKPPAITIDHTLPRFLTRDQKALGFDLDLSLVTGEPVTDARVKLLATTRKGTALFERTLKLTGAGPHTVELAVAELETLIDATSEDDYAILVLEVRDGEGRRDEIRRELRISDNPYVAVLELDKDQYATGEPVSVAVRVRDLDQVPTRDTPIRVELRGHDGKTKTLTAKTDAKGTAKIALTMPDKGGELALFMPEVERAVAQATLRWVAERPMRSQVEDLIIAERETTKLVVRFPSGYRPADRWVHVDVVDTSGALVNATLLAVAEDQGEWVARGELEAPTWGSMLLTLFALGERDDPAGQSSGPGEIGLLTEGQNLVVHPDKQLEITLKGFPQAAKPGDALAVEAEIRDAQGQLVDAAVGVSLVDASVVDLKDPLEITPMDRFYSPELRTLSTTGSKILTWPVVSRNWGPAQIDVALPPFPYLEGGPALSCRDSGHGVGGAGYVSGGIGVGSVGLVGKGSAGGTVSGYGTGAGKTKPSGSQAKLDEHSMDLMFESEIEGELEADGAVGAGAPAPTPMTGGAGQLPREQPASPAIPATITVRTQLPEVSLWQPNARAEAGAFAVKTTLPDAIGEQELILVASDARGGVGVARERVRIEQPVHVEVDLPARLIAGEQVELPVLVRNHSGRDGQFELELRAAGATQSGRVTIADGQRGGQRLAVAAAQPGRAQVSARAAGAGHDDTLRRELTVVARGVPVSRVEQRSLAGGQRLTLEFELREPGNDAQLRVRLPGLVGAFAGLEGLDATLRDDPDALAVDLSTAALILQRAAAAKLTSPALTELRERALADLAFLRLVQAGDGGFAYWRNGKPSPFVTAWALDGMLEAREAGLPDDPLSIRRAAEFLTNSFASDGLITVADIGWWEGSSDAVRLGLSAEVYAILARIPDSELSTPVRKRLAQLDQRMLDELDAGLREPLAAAWAIRGLDRRGKIDAARARELVRALIAIRDGSHWEPSWFHAYGGRLAATAVLIEVMAELDASGFAFEIRDALAWLQSTRESWGVWHNERGTAAALRALAHAPIPAGGATDLPARVEVWLDGARVETVEITREDPLISALPLSRLELGQGLAPGKHRVELIYTGKSSASVELELREWQAGRAGKAEAKAKAKRALAAQGPAKLAIGASGRLRVELDGRTRGGTLVVGASNLVEVDLVGLGAWVGPGRPLRSARLVEGRVELELAPNADELRFEVPLVGIRRGQGHAPSVAWLPASGQPEAEALVVDPGPLEVR